VTLISNPDVGTFLEAAATIVSRLEQKAVVVFYDKYQDHRLLEKLQQLLSDKSIPSLTFQIDDSASNLTSILRNVVWKRYRNTLVLCTPENVDAVLREMLEMKAVEAVLSFASATQSLLDSSGLPASNASCRPLQPWSAGPALAAQLKQVRIVPEQVLMDD
uniref:ANF_receptor domain-containing protein n=1 Tax=Macrostomum lignano TaxID=282301 RepID=A0A1I8GN99_9PLAT